jgi:hypothetical protein
VFVTALAEHAVRAFECDVLDYLLKPIRRARASALALWSRKGLRQVAHDDIVHIVARDDHSELYLRDGTSYLDATRMRAGSGACRRRFCASTQPHRPERGGGCLPPLQWLDARARGMLAVRPHTIAGGRDTEAPGEPSAALVPISRGRVAAVRAALGAPGARHVAILR